VVIKCTTVIPAQAGISLSHCSVILGLRPVCVRCPHRQARGSINYFIYTSYSFFTTKTIISLFAHLKRKRKRAPLIPHMSDDFHTHSLFFVTPPSSRQTQKIHSITAMNVFLHESSRSCSVWANYTMRAFARIVSPPQMRRGLRGGDD